MRPIIGTRSGHLLAGGLSTGFGSGVQLLLWAPGRRCTLRELLLRAAATTRAGPMTPRPGRASIAKIFAINILLSFAPTSWLIF